MKGKHRLLYTAVFLLVILSIVACAFPSSAQTLNPWLLARADTIDAALTEAFHQKSEELLALAEEYRAGTKTPTDSYGNPLDKNEAIAFLEATAERLPLLKADTYALAIVENAYESVYVDTYQSMEALAPKMADILVSLFDLTKLTSETVVGDALIRSYMLAIGDKYASYFDESEMAEYEADNQAEYGGIGVTVTQLEDGYVEVLDVTPDSPAEKEGVRVGDVIVGVNGEDFAKIGYSAAINMIRGKEGESVTITLKRGEETFDLTLTRETITEYTVTYKMLSLGGGKTGFIRISGFDEKTFTQFAQAYEALRKAGAEKFVFDVRNNPGGRLEAVLGILEYILPEKEDLPLIRMEYKAKSVSYFSVFDYIEKSGGGASMKATYAKAKNHQIDAPIAVLCNEFTASAGELFTSCLKDYDAAVIFGTSTYGKGMGQSGYQLTDGTKAYKRFAVFNISTFYYSPPLSENYEGKGITPDQTVDLSEEAKAINFYKLSEDMDDQLKAATDYLATREGVPYDPEREEPKDENGGGGRTALWVLFGILSATTVALTVFFVLALSREGKKKENLFERVSAAPEQSENGESKED